MADRTIQHDHSWYIMNMHSQSFNTRQSTTRCNLPPCNVSVFDNPNMICNLSDKVASLTISLDNAGSLGCCTLWDISSTWLPVASASITSISLFCLSQSIGKKDTSAKWHLAHIDNTNVEMVYCPMLWNGSAFHDYWHTLYNRPFLAEGPSIPSAQQGRSRKKSEIPVDRVVC